MKKIFFLAAMLSFLAIYSCQDNVVPENNKEESTQNNTEESTENNTEESENNEEESTPVTVEGSYTIGGRSGKITSAYYGISSTGECRFILRPDGLPYSLLPPYDAFLLEISFPEQTPKLQPGTYTTSDDGGIQMAAFAKGSTVANAQEYMFESAKAELSKTGDYYTLTLSGTSGDDIVSVTYTGPFFEFDFDTQRILGSGSCSIGNFSSSLRYAYVDIRVYDESEKRTGLYLHICSVPENVNGSNRINEFFFYLRFPGEVSKLQPGTYKKETGDIIRESFYNATGEESIEFKTLTLEISEEGTDYQGTDYKITATGTLADEDESKVSVDFSGYVTYIHY